MKKLLMSLLLCVSISAFAKDASLFTEFENEYNIGYQFIQMDLINGAQQITKVNQQAVNLEIEHLFDMGVWLDANLNMTTSYSQPTLGPSYLNGGSGGQGTDNNPADQAYAFGQNPFMYSINLKGGYAFSLLDDKIQLLPYATFGRSANWSSSTIVANNYQPLTNDYFLTGGFGIRLSYRFDNALMLYADELYNYNWDNSGAIKTTQIAIYGKSYAATSYQMITTIGAKYNVTNAIQIGLNGFWNSYQHQSNIAGIVYTPQNTFGEMVTIGLTY